MFEFEIDEYDYTSIESIICERYNLGQHQSSGIPHYYEGDITEKMMLSGLDSSKEFNISIWKTLKGYQIRVNEN